MNQSGRNRQFRFMIIAQLIWLSLICLMGTWWGWLLLKQASRIADLERALGPGYMAEMRWHPIEKMVFWEALTFLTLILASSGYLFRLYWKDLIRTRSIQAFFASVTHELRTPLSSIRLQAESIADQGSSQSPLVQRLLEDTIRLESQVDRTLELARLEGGGPVFREAVQLIPWLERFISIWMRNYPNKVEFKLDLEDQIVEADPHALSIIFRNLFENSIKHSCKENSVQGDRKVQVSLRTLPPKADEIHPRSSRSVRLDVRDDGSGYVGSFQELGRIFHKGDHSSGTGVGLYLIRKLMKKMGGTVKFYTPSAESDQPNGFGVVLQFREAENG